MKESSRTLTRLRRVVASVGVSLLVSSSATAPLPAQSASNATSAAIKMRVPTESLVREARDKAASGDTSAALALLEQATDQSPRDVDALYWRGLMLSRTTVLSVLDTPRRLLARRLLDRASEIDPKNPRYLIELARIRLKTPLLRVEAERLFRRALSIAEDSGDPMQLADVAYELGSVKERRYLTGRGRRLYTSPNVIFDPIAARGQQHYTREFLNVLSQPIENAGNVDREEAEVYFRRALAAVPTHAPSAVSLMGLMYDQRRYDEMLRIAAPFFAAAKGNARNSEPRNGEPPARVLFATALATYKLGELLRADTLFNRALAQFAPAERAELTHLGRISRKGDSVRIAGLNDADRQRTDSAFWEAADPMLSTPANEARLEFLARMAYADLRFTDEDMRQVGWRTDRGLIIARYGEPPVIATFPPTSEPDAWDALARVITVWYYPRLNIEFVFFGPPAMNAAFFAGNHRGFTEQQREDMPFLLDNLPMVLAVDTVPLQLARFRGATPTTSQLVIAASVPTDRLYGNAEIDRGALEASVRVGESAYLKLTHIDTTDVRLPTTRRLTRAWVDTIPANREQRVRVEVRDPSLLNAMGRAQMELAPLEKATGALALSDLLFANRPATPPNPVRSWNVMGLVPRGDLTLAQRDTFAVYWENYGLTANAEGRVNYEVRMVVTIEQIARGGALNRFFGGLQDVVGLSPEGDEQLGLRFERSEVLGNRDRVPDVVTMGLGTAPAGRYRLDVIITDRNTKATTRSQRRFHIRGEQ